MGGSVFLLLHIGCIYVGDIESVGLCVLVEDIACWIVGFRCMLCVGVCMCVCVCTHAQKHKRFLLHFVLVPLPIII